MEIAGLNEDERQSLVDEFVRRNADGYPLIDPAKLSVEASDSAVDANQFVVDRVLVCCDFWFGLDRRNAFDVRIDWSTFRTHLTKTD